MILIVLKILSVLLAIIGTTMLIPLAFAFYYAEYSVILSFVVPMVCSWIFALIFIFASRNKNQDFSIRLSFLIVALAWISSSLFGSLPLYFSGAIPNFVDALFESVSGFSTTGATILADVESLPKSMNLWRCLTNWLGGMGIVALTVALLPLIGVGGFALIKAETTGPEKGKFTPKIATTAKILWFIYLGMTIIETVLLKIAGLNFYEALAHAFSNIATGGFSTRNSSIAAYNNPFIDWICVAFMFLNAINFSLYFYLFTGKFKEIKYNSEFKAYIVIVLFCILAITLLQASSYGGFFESLRYSAFQVTSIISTTGFATFDYTLWKNASQVLIFVLLFIGGCSGSTSGGIKVVRWVILSKQLKNEMNKMVHPHGIYSVRLNNRSGRKDIVYTVAAFFFLYCIFVFLTTFVGCIFNMDIFTSFTGAASMIGNVGPAFNMLGPSANCSWLASPVKLWYCIAMIAGRLELFTVYIFFTKSYWKK